jgi:RHS repeat-associated protein
VTYTYDANGNRLTASDGASTITSTYDRLNRPLSVSVSDDPDALTSYAYSFTAPGWVDASGGSSVGVDAFGREVSLLDPIHGSTPWTSTYRADGQPAALAAPNGNTTTWTYDQAGRPTGSATTAPGPVTRASYSYALNRAGQRLSETSTITGDPTNGTVTFAYDPLGRLTGYSGTPVPSQTYAWDKVPNRTSKQVGGGSAITTTFNDANRPTSDSAGGTYTNDLDGRLTGRPGQELVWDALGRLIEVRDAATQAPISTYAYDALDRLASVCCTQNNKPRAKFRYQGETSQIIEARTFNDQLIYGVGTSYAGEARMDFGSGGTNQRFYGTNGHRDLTWTAGSTGTVSASLRSDPWGIPGTTTGGTLPDFRFQGSWYDTSSALSWAINRWYAPQLGSFLSEDAVLGATQQPENRHRYAYGAGDAVDRIDTNGNDWCAYYSPCTTATVYHSKLPTDWSGSFTPLSTKATFRLDLFIESQWVRAPYWTLKGDWRDVGWRGFVRGGNCLLTRACITISLSAGSVRVHVNPSCLKNSPYGDGKVDYDCSNARDINSWWPFQSAVSAYRTTYRAPGVVAPMVHVSWSLNDSALPGMCPLDGWIDIVPPTSTFAGFVKEFYDGFPNVGTYFRRPYWYYTAWKTVARSPEPESNWVNLCSFPGDHTEKYPWPG